MSTIRGFRRQNVNGDRGFTAYFAERGVLEGPAMVAALKKGQTGVRTQPESA
jgi:hypothetical protein